MEDNETAKTCKAEEARVSIWSASYSLEKNSGSGGAVISFTDQARTCTCIVHDY